jgi:hypothetical protein
MSFLRFLVLAVATFAISGVAAAQTVSLPADLQSNPRELWRAIMTSVYGPYDKRRRCWVGKKGNDAFCMRPHKLDTITLNGSERIFAAVGGAPIVGGEDCHSCAGNLGLLIFERAGGAFRLIASNGLFEEMGSWGSVPPEESFAVEKIGPEAYGWVIETGYTAQGVTGAGKEIFVDEGDAVVSLGAISISLDNCGAVEDGQPCQNYAFDLKFGPGGSGRFYDAVAELTKKSDKPPGPARYDVPFDTGVKKYQPPEALETLLEM